MQKLHVKYDSAQPFKRGILIIREPVAATRSFVDFMESGHTGWASPTTFNRKGCHDVDFFKNFLSYIYVNFILKYLD